MEERTDSALAGVDVAGPPDAQPIVFLHGATFTRTQWAPQRDALADEFRVVAPDLPGHGSRAGERFHLGSAIDRLTTVLERVTRGPAVLVGLSLGGYVATAYAGRYPDRVDGLVLLGCSANPVGSLSLLTRLLGGVARLATRSRLVERAVERLAKRWIRNRDLEPEHEAEILEAGVYPRQFGLAGPDLAGYDFRTDLEFYDGPVVIANGDGDRLMQRGAPAHAEAGGSSDPAPTVTIEDGGHVASLHRPSAVTDLVRTFTRELANERGT